MQQREQMRPSSNDDDAILPTIGGGPFTDMHRAAELLVRAPSDAPYVGEAFINIMIDCLFFLVGGPNE